MFQVSQIAAVQQNPPPIDSLKWCKVPLSDFNTTGVGSPDDTDFDRLLPAIVQVFAVTMCGYLAGRFKLISLSDTKGLNDFTTYFTLLPLIILNLMTLSFEFVNWMFVLSILLGKLVVFVLVAFVTSAIQKPINLAYAGIYGIFCTQGNDFGIGYPIIASLYGSKRPLYPGYMYLISPTSLVVVNPLGFLLMAVQKSRTTQRDSSEATYFGSALRTLGAVSWAVLKNHVVCATLLGILGNFLLQGKIPSIVYGILQLLSSAFSASVLFLLGLSVAGSGKSLKRDGLLIPFVLLLIKMFVSPLVTRGCVLLLCSSFPDADDLADFGFLYGTIPTGPIVMIFAAEYGLSTEMMASSMVMSTTLFGPVIFILARMMSLNIKGPDEYTAELRETMFILSILSLLSCLWICLCVAISQKWRYHVYKILVCLLCSQITMAIGIFMWGFLPRDHTLLMYFEIAFIMAGQLMSRIWAMLLAVTLLFKQKYPNSLFVKNIAYPIGFGFGIPCFLIIALIITTALGKCEPDFTHQLPLFLYGSSEAIAAVVVLLMCLIITSSSLILYYRSVTQEHDNDYEPSRTDPHQGDNTSSGITLMENGICSPDNLADEAVLAISKLTEFQSDSKISNLKPEEDRRQKDICKEIKKKFRGSIFGCFKRSETTLSEDNLLNARFSAGGKSLTSLSQEYLTSGVDISSNTTSSVTPISSPCKESSSEDTNKNKTFLRHVIILILSCISMAVGLTTSTWKLTNTHPNGLFVAMEFLDAVLSIGQGVFVFIVFIKDSRHVLTPIRKWFRKLNCHFTSLDLGTDEVDDITVHHSQQFLTYHYDNCIRELPCTISDKNHCYSECFTGRDFVDWLMTVGLAQNRSSAELYGQKLFRGKVLHNVSLVVQFHDNDHYIYKLAEKKST